MTDTTKPDEKQTEPLVVTAVYVPGRGLVLMEPDLVEHGLERAGLEKSRMATCFGVRGADRGTEWIHFYSAVVDEDAAERLKAGEKVPVPLSFSIQGGALLIQHEDEGFVRAYSANTWERITRFDEEFIGTEDEDSPAGE